MKEATNNQSGNLQCFYPVRGGGNYSDEGDMKFKRLSDCVKQDLEERVRK